MKKFLNILKKIKKLIKVKRYQHKKNKSFFVDLKKIHTKREIINKCIDLNSDMDLESKIHLYCFCKQELKASDNFLDFLKNLSYCYITAYSLFDKVIDIHYYPYTEIIANELLENLEHLPSKLIEKCNAECLEKKIIIKEIEEILKDYNDYEEMKI